MKYWFALLILTASITLAADGKATAIDLEATSDVYFSSTERTDRITSSIKGASCESAMFDISIRGKHGVLFHWSNPLIPQTCEWLQRDPEHAKQALINTVNQPVGPARAANYSCGPPRQIGCKASPILERLRSVDAPMVCFSVGAESASCVAYDSETGAVVEAWRYSE